ncbi:hypothetical protein [Ancylomarina sp.]|uniref:hypothetical protein n=1 Tax=Ancylomarina sp. TaxID=1970196 RepID=UPI003561B34E
MDSLSGKWLYEEDYSYGKAKGELFLRQIGKRLIGKIIFLENIDSSNSIMIQEFLEGEINGSQIILKATEYDIIHSDKTIFYELDCWKGILLNEFTIEGESLDNQGIYGSFIFHKVQ